MSLELADSSKACPSSDRKNEERRLPKTEGKRQRSSYRKERKTPKKFPWSALLKYGFLGEIVVVSQNAENRGYIV